MLGAAMVSEGPIEPSAHDAAFCIAKAGEGHVAHPRCDGTADPHTHVAGADASASHGGLTDERLAESAARGCLASFDQLARRSQVPLVRFLQRRFPSRRDAEDVAQEALIGAYRAIGRYRTGARFRPWLFTIAYRIAVSRGRSDAAERRTAGEGLAESLGDPSPGPPQEAIAREARESLWSVARRELSHDQVTALWLFYVEEMPAGDVARVMGRSWVSVKTMLHRARHRLAGHVTPDGSLRAVDEATDRATAGEAARRPGVAARGEVRSARAQTDRPPAALRSGDVS